MIAVNDNMQGSQGLVPFRSATVAWMWTMGFLMARRDGAGAAFGTGGRRICEPDDVVKVLDRLYRERRITLAHARILRTYGEAQAEPGVASARDDRRLWDEAMRALDRPLRERGIVR